MSDNQNGYGQGVCDVCARNHTWGCGHSGAQEHAARKHRGTRKHHERRCRCYGHDNCRPEDCRLAGIVVAGYAPFYQHVEK